MTYQILSTQINPYVRFAGYRDGYSNLYKRTSYARDCRLFYFTKGRVILMIDKAEWTFEQGDVLMLPPMCPYKVERETDCAFYLVNFDYLISEKTPERAIPVSFSPDCSPVQKVCFRDLPQLDEPLKISVSGLEPLFSNMTSLYKEKTFYFRSEMNAYFSLILSQLFEHILSHKNDKAISDIIEYVNGNYMKPLTNKAVGEHFHYHPNYVNRLFVRHTGLSLHKYLINYRIDTAIIMLLSGTDSITEIASKTGWNNVGHFSGYFKKITGCSPSCFRERGMYYLGKGRNKL